MELLFSPLTNGADQLVLSLAALQSLENLDHPRQQLPHL